MGVPLNEDPEVLEPFTAAVAANRFGLGARPGDLAHIGGQPRDWLGVQLTGNAPRIVNPELRSSGFTIRGALPVSCTPSQSRGWPPMWARSPGRAPSPKRLAATAAVKGSSTSGSSFRGTPIAVSY